MKAAFCCHSGNHVGYGNLSRCAALARGFVAAGDEVVIHNDGPWPAFIAGNLNRVSERIEAIGHGDIVIFDGVDSELLQAAKTQNPAALIVRIDDMGDRCIGADVVINPNLYGDLISYPAAVTVFGGARYNLIEPAVFDARDGERLPNSAVVSFGGSDDGRYGVPTALALAQRGMHVTLLMTVTEPEFNQPWAQQLRAVGVEVRFRQPSQPFLASHHLYVGAAGVTSGEALAAGCRIAVCSIVDNQRQNVEQLQLAGYAAVQGFDLQQLMIRVEEALAVGHCPAEVVSDSGVARLVQALHECVNPPAGDAHAHTRL